jgi:hypothetical protein
MPGLTNYVRKRALTVLMGTDFAGVSALYFSLFTVNPTDDGTAAGVTDETESSLPRVQILQVTDATLPYFVEEEDTVAANNGRRLRLVNALEYTDTDTTSALGGGDETMTGGGVYTASSGGTLLCWGAFTSSTTMSAGDYYVFQSGDIILQLRKDV